MSVNATDKGLFSRTGQKSRFHLLCPYSGLG